jgi:light-regulated signal transduction histidine kinase (bacteriophytochrome)
VIAATSAYGETRGRDDLSRALLNILEDADAERAGVLSTQRAVLNILEDADAEREDLRATQRAVLNILEDYDEKLGVDQTNLELKREIVDRKVAEEALRRAKTVAEAANGELEAFSYSVSHDLRAPLRAIDGFSLALSEDSADQLNAEGRQHLERIRAGVQRMGKLIDDLLQLAGVTRSEMRQEAVDLTALAREIAAELQATDRDRDVTFAIGAGLTVHGDQRLLRIALVNLLSNAWKFTRSRPVARIELGSVVADGAIAYFVRDNGVGFDMAYGAKLFGAFQRLHASAEFEGTGIGLATVRRIVARHGGRTWADGAIDAGATFWFTIASEGALTS